MQRAHRTRFMCECGFGEVQQFFVNGEVDNRLRFQSTVGPFRPSVRVCLDLGCCCVLAGIPARD